MGSVDQMLGYQQALLLVQVSLCHVICFKNKLRTNYPLEGKTNNPASENKVFPTVIITT